MMRPLLVAVSASLLAAACTTEPRPDPAAPASAAQPKPDTEPAPAYVYPPVAVAGGLTFVSLSTGNSHTCGLTSSGAAYCWGSNGYGQLGLGDTSITQRTAPVAVAGGLTFAELTAFGDHTCGVTTSGAAYCWGRNFLGPLGDGTTTNRAAPVPVAGGLTFRSLVGGYDHTCGLTTTGAAYCWGEGEASELGDSANVDRWAPVPVHGGLTFVSLALGGEHTCGLTSSGAAYCWGANNAGQLGLGYFDATIAPKDFAWPITPRVPMPVAGGLTFASLAAGGAQSCGVTAAGAAYCWGQNVAGELGVGYGGGSHPMSTVPVAVAGGLTFARVSALEQSTCGITTAGAAYCWGVNVPVGDTLIISMTPFAVAQGLVFVSLSVGSGHTCGLTSSGAAYCWGNRANGQLGNGP